MGGRTSLAAAIFDTATTRCAWSDRCRKYAVGAVKVVALAIVVVFFVLPYALTALAVAGGAILVLRILRN